VRLVLPVFLVLPVLLVLLVPPVLVSLRLPLGRLAQLAWLRLPKQVSLPGLRL
jgi:hypothetical protein